MAEGSQSPSAAGRVGLILAGLTFVATALNAIPPFLALRGTEPYVVYETDQAQMLYPEGADRTAIRKLLKEQKLPDAFVSLVLSNRGDTVAREVIVVVTLPGTVVAVKTEPILTQGRLG